MADIFGIALSGMQAARAQLAVGANNIANANTAGFKASRVDLAELSGGGVAVAGVQQDLTPGAIGPDGQQTSNVDLSAEMVGLTRDQVLYDANAAVVRIAGQMTGTLLDMMDSDHHGGAKHISTV